MIQRALRPVTTWLRRHPWLARQGLSVLPDLPMTIKVAGIGPFRIRLRRNRSFWLRDPFTLERFPLAALKALVRPGDVVYDVGANIGLYTRLSISSFHAGRVVAFEPMTDNVRQLRENVSLGNIGDRVTILPLALSESDDAQELQVDDISSASAVLAAVSGGRAAEGRMLYRLPPKSERVACRRLDSLRAEGTIPPPDVIKVDVEGAEDLFLGGAANCLQQIGPKLLVELHGADKARAVYDRLSNCGYHCTGKLDAKFAPSGYGRIEQGMIERVNSFYDIHFLIAAKDPADLPTTVDEFRP